MNWSDWANRTIPQPSKGVVLKKRNYRLNDIGALCEAAYKEDRHMLEQFARAFPPTLEGLKMLFDFCDHHFAYTEDPSQDASGNAMPVQAVQSPAALWHVTKNGDCKSYTVFIASCIHQMDIPVERWLVDYGNLLEKHIYPVAILNGQRIPVDVVYKKQQNGAFGTEKKPFRTMKRFIDRPGLYKVGKMASPASEHDLLRYAHQVESDFSDIPETVLSEDITLMTAGEFERWQLRERLKAFDRHESDPQLKRVYKGGIRALTAASVSGIGEIAETPFGRKLHRFIIKTSNDNRPAFPTFKAGIANLPTGNEVSGLFGSIKNAVKKVAGVIGKAVKKLANVFHKGAAGAMAPFFLFQFMSKKQLSRAKPEVKRRHKKQQFMMKHMEKRGKLGSQAQIKASMATAMKKHYGAMPEEILAAAGKPKVGAVGAAVMAATTLAKNPAIAKKAFGVIKGLAKKLFSIFKKKNREDKQFEDWANDGNSSDLNLLYSEDGSEGNTITKYDGSGINPTPGNNANKGDTSGSGGNMMMWVALAVGAAVLLKK